jgi:hypothetical protein
MHWLCIDRYYSHEETFAGDVELKENAHGLTSVIGTLKDMEDPSENPQIAFQPIMYVNIVITHHVKLFVQLQLHHIASRSKPYGLQQMYRCWYSLLC